MNIKIAGLSLGLAASLFGGVTLLQAAPKEAAGAAETAAPTPTEDGYAVFACADGWDKLSKKRVETLMADAEIKEALGSALVYSIGVPIIAGENTKKQQQDFAARCKKVTHVQLKLGDAPSYPAIHLYTKDGRRYTTLSGPLIAKGSPGEIAEAIRERMKQGKEQSELIEKAGRTGGVEKAALLLATTRMPGLEWPDNALNKIKQADPKDGSGAVRSLSFNGYGFACDLRKKMPEEALAEVEKRLADPAYSDRQKQQICAAAIGYLRAKRGMSASPDIRRYAQRMKAYGCDTPETAAGDIVVRDWTAVLSLKEGWTPTTLPRDKNPVEVIGDHGMDKAGTYSVRFDYKKGSKALTILAVELYDGEKKVAEDRHKGITGDKVSNNFYKLVVPEDVKEPHLYITVDMPNTDSYGSITVTRM